MIDGNYSGFKAVLYDIRSVSVHRLPSASSNSCFWVNLEYNIPNFANLLSYTASQGIIQLCFKYGRFTSTD
jgi:hypothetical protein